MYMFKILESKQKYWEGGVYGNVGLGLVWRLVQGCVKVIFLVGKVWVLGMKWV